MYRVVSNRTRKRTNLRDSVVIRIFGTTQADLPATARVPASDLRSLAHLAYVKVVDDELAASGSESESE